MTYQRNRAPSRAEDRHARVGPPRSVSRPFYYDPDSGPDVPVVGGWIDEVVSSMTASSAKWPKALMMMWLRREQQRACEAFSTGESYRVMAVRSIATLARWSYSSVHRLATEDLSEWSNPEHHEQWLELRELGWVWGIGSAKADPSVALIPDNAVGPAVYAIEAIGVGRVKIGHTTTHIKTRAMALSTACPVPMRLIGWWPGTPADEVAAHDALQQHRATGEWFNLTESVLGYIAERSVLE